MCTVHSSGRLVHLGWSKRQVGNLRVYPTLCVKHWLADHCVCCHATCNTVAICVCLLVGCVLAVEVHRRSDDCCGFIVRVLELNHNTRLCNFHVLRTQCIHTYMYIVVVVTWHIVCIGLFHIQEWDWDRTDVLCQTSKQFVFFMCTSKEISHSCIIVRVHLYSM